MYVHYRTGKIGSRRLVSIPCSQAYSRCTHLGKFECQLQTLTIAILRETQHILLQSPAIPDRLVLFVELGEAIITTVIRWTYPDWTFDLQWLVVHVRYKMQSFNVQIKHADYLKVILTCKHYRKKCYLIQNQWKIMS